MEWDWHSLIFPVDPYNRSSVLTPIVAAVVFAKDRMGQPPEFPAWRAFDPVAGWLALAVFAVLIVYMIFVPLRKAGAADEPAPPTAVM